MLCKCFNADSFYFFIIYGMNLLQIAVLEDNFFAVGCFRNERLLVTNPFLEVFNFK